MSASAQAAPVAPTPASAFAVFRGEQRATVLLLLAALGALAAAAWAFTYWAGGSMSSSTMAAMVAGGDLGMIGFFLLIWAAMMVAMMFPAAAPMAVAYVHLARADSDRSPWWTGRAAVFLGSYVAVWSLTGVVAVLAYLVLGRSLAGFAMAGVFPPVAVGAVLVVAGLYQTTTLKETCVTGCRSPVSFLVEHWRSGLRGAARLGLRHAAYCVGCCGLLFAVLFVVGTMSLAWMALLAALVFVEKLAVGRAGRLISWGIGGAMAAGGVAILIVPGWAAIAVGL